jgi:hypothetical protein
MSFAASLGATEPVSKLEASQSGTCLRLDEARGLTVFGEPGNKLGPALQRRRALTGYAP